MKNRLRNSSRGCAGSAACRSVQSSRRRTGAASLEAAFALPALIVLVLGAIESSNAIYARHAIAIAAYDAARVVTNREGTETEARKRCQELLSAHGITSWQVSFDPPVTDETETATRVRVTVSALADDVSLGLMPLFTGRRLSHSVVMARL